MKTNNKYQIGQLAALRKADVYRLCLQEFGTNSAQHFARCTKGEMMTALLAIETSVASMQRYEFYFSLQYLTHCGVELPTSYIDRLYDEINAAYKACLNAYDDTDTDADTSWLDFVAKWLSQHTYYTVWVEHSGETDYLYRTLQDAQRKAQDVQRAGYKAQIQKLIDWK